MPFLRAPLLWTVMFLGASCASGFVPGGDGGLRPDANEIADGGKPDAGAQDLDAGAMDGGTDSGVPPNTDGGNDAGSDAGLVPDSGAPDASGYPLTSPSFHRIMNADQVNGWQNYAYAYGPAIVRDSAGVFHLFVCSPGSQVSGAWDYIREVHSSDRINWSLPTVVLTATPRSNRDYSACDPSVVQYGGYFYLFYSGADLIQASPALYKTVIKVARSATIDGAYLKYTDRGTWEADPADPKNIIEPLGNPANRYGAGQQSVVVHNGKLLMWYVDDTLAGKGPVYFLQSSDPVTWSPNAAAVTDNGITALDVKYDERSRMFVSIAVPTYLNIAAMYLRQSSDGVHWSDLIYIVESSHFPHYARVEGGQSGDALGHWQTGPAVFAFAAPHNLVDAPSVAYWDAYGILVDSPSAMFFRDSVTVPLRRYTNNVNDHWTSTGVVALGYYLEGVIAHLYSLPQPGTVALYGCRASGGVDHFLSLDAACAGATALGLEGYVYPSPASGAATTPLHLCHNTAGDHFVTADPGCEGPAQIHDALLGYGRAAP